MFQAHRSLSTEYKTDAADEGLRGRNILQLVAIDWLILLHMYQQDLIANIVLIRI